MKEIFGLKVKELRERNGITQEELARRLGYSHKSSISKIEDGLSKVPAYKIIKFAEALNCAPEELINIKSEVPVAPNKEYLEDVEKFASLQSILEMLSKMDAKQIIKAEKVIRTLSED